MESGVLPKLTVEQALVNFREANEGGLLKIMSKMGISLLESYMGAQIFEAIGVGGDLLQLGFRGTPSRVGGLSVEELAQEVGGFVGKALEMADPGNEKASKKLENYGFYRFMVKGEYHHNSPQLSKLLHKAIAGDGDVSQYELFSRAVSERPPTTLRDLLDVKTDRSPVPLAEVEPVEAIMRRFCTGGMSLGALSRECHETLAIAMNRIGGKSNSGEGGEDPVRFKPLGDVDDSTGLSPRLPHLKGLRNGDIATSAIKQVASGR
jgi:glutamate synthase (ferredoxin)